jgi:hypothetical protein
MRNLTTVQLLPIETPTANNSKTASHAAITITFTGETNCREVLTWLCWSYSLDPVAGGITITDGASHIIFQIDITKGGPGAIPLPYIPTSIGGTLAVVLADGGAGCTGKLNVYSVAERTTTAMDISEAT